MQIKIINKSVSILDEVYSNELKITIHAIKKSRFNAIIYTHFYRKHSHKIISNENINKYKIVELRIHIISDRHKNNASKTIKHFHHQNTWHAFFILK